MIRNLVHNDIIIHFTFRRTTLFTSRSTKKRSELPQNSNLFFTVGASFLDPSTLSPFGNEDPPIFSRNFSLVMNPGSSSTTYKENEYDEMLTIY